jgi:hypothetical protein
MEAFVHLLGGEVPVGKCLLKAPPTVAAACLVTSTTPVHLNVGNGDNG